jgi:hypothetical protein
VGVLILVLVAVRTWGPDDAAARLGSGASWLNDRLGIAAAAGTVGGYVRPLAAHIGDSVYNATQAVLEGIASTVDGGWNSLVRAGRRMRDSAAGTAESKSDRKRPNEPPAPAGQ